VSIIASVDCASRPDDGPLAGQYFSILQYSKEYGTAVSDFLRRQGRNDLAWLQFLEESDFSKTGNAALKAADAESLAHSQQILLSVVKLTRCAMKARGKDSTALDNAGEIIVFVGSDTTPC
jgi:hypothetical protein